MSRMINGRLYASTQEAADALSINNRTMLRWLRKGTIDLKHGSYKGKNTKTIPLQVYVHPISGYYFILREQLDALVALFGATKEWTEEYNNRMRAIGDAIKKDLGLSSNEKPELTPETKLGPSATHAFESFHEWVKTTAHKQTDDTAHDGKLE